MTNPVLLGFAGRLGSGKDTAIQAIQTFDSRCVRLAFADPIYDAIYAFNPIITYSWWRSPVRLQTLVDAYGWEYTKRGYPEVRRSLQRMGTEVGRVLWGNPFWVDKLFDKWDPAVPTLISGVRFPEEVAAIKDRGGQVWYVERPDIRLERHHQHKSEHVLDKQVCAHHFVNRSISEFQCDIVHEFNNYMAENAKKSPKVSNITR